MEDRKTNAKDNREKKPKDMRKYIMREFKNGQSQHFNKVLTCYVTYE